MSEFKAFYKNGTKEISMLEIDNAQIIFRNFSGKETEFNREGRHTFAVVIENQDLVDELIDNDWNVKPLKSRDENEPIKYRLNLEARFDKFPPKIEVISDKTKTRLDEDDICMLDNVDFENVDLLINPSHWSSNGKPAVKAYLKQMVAIIEQSPLDIKYSEMEYPEEDPSEWLPFD